MGDFRGQAWAQATQQKRIPPGRGPLFTRRVLPSRLPRLRKEALASGIPRRTLDGWERPARGIVLPPLPEKKAQVHPRLGPAGHGDRTAPFAWDVVTRLRSHWLMAQRSVVSGWAAIAVYGLPYWADSEHVVLLSDTTRGAGGLRRPVVRPMPDGLYVLCPDPAFPRMRVVTPETAAAQCLASVLHGRTVWPVPPVPGTDPRHVRAVQFLDACHQATLLTGGDILDGAHGRVDRSLLRRLLDLSDDGAHSPMETVFRLVVNGELPDGYGWTSQRRISLETGETVSRSQGFTGYVRSTVPDLSCPELGVALYYDGKHHRSEEQKTTDFALYQKLKGVGWEALRVDSALLADRAELTDQLRGAVARAVRDRGQTLRTD